MTTAPNALPADVQTFFDTLRRLGKKRPNLALTDADFEIAARRYRGDTLQVIADSVGLSRQSVHRRKGVIRDTLQLYFLCVPDHEDDAIQAYQRVYERIR